MADPLLPSVMAMSVRRRALSGTVPFVPSRKRPGGGEKVEKKRRKLERWGEEEEGKVRM